MPTRDMGVTRQGPVPGCNSDGPFGQCTGCGGNPGTGHCD